MNNFINLTLYIQIYHLFNLLKILIQMDKREK